MLSQKERVEAGGTLVNPVRSGSDPLYAAANVPVGSRLL